MPVLLNSEGYWCDWTHFLLLKIRGMAHLERVVGVINYSGLSPSNWRMRDVDGTSRVFLKFFFAF